ncbi:MAG: hypothetical protein HF962_05825 [Sulfurovum sp.]|nr:hypothetical protein [Sulfurovum sp.]
MNETHPLVTHEHSNSIQHPMLAVVEKQYRDGVVAYAEGIQYYSLEIEKLKEQISMRISSIKQEEQALSNTTEELGYNQRLLARLNEQCSIKLNSIQELNSRYKAVMELKQYHAISKQKRLELKELLNDTEELEITLLGNEMQRLNLLEKLEPKKEAISELQMKLKILELEKKHFESSKLHRIIQPHNKKTKADILVDTVAM